MMIQGITSHDLLDSYIERYYSNKVVLVIRLNSSDGCQRILADIRDQLNLPIPERIEIQSDYILLCSNREELTEFIKNHQYQVYCTLLELYVDACRYMSN